MIAPVTLKGLRARRDEILEIARRHGAEEVRVFGSVVRGPVDAESDLDFVDILERARRIRRYVREVGTPSSLPRCYRTPPSGTWR